MAREIAKEFTEAAARLMDSAASPAHRDAVAARIWDVHWMMLGYRPGDTKAIAIAFVTSIHEAIKHLEYGRSQEPEALIAGHTQLTENEMSSLLHHLQRNKVWAERTSFGERARWWFSRWYPEHAKRLAVSDVDLAVSASRGETGDKWGTLAKIISERLHVQVRAQRLGVGGAST